MKIEEVGISISSRTKSTYSIIRICSEKVDSSVLFIDLYNYKVIDELARRIGTI